MAKRTSKKSTSSVLQKEEPAIKETALAEPKKEEIKKPRAKKVRSEVTKKDKPASKSADTKKEKPATKKPSTIAAKEKAEKKPVAKKATSTEAKKERVNRPAVRKSASVNAAKPALRSVYSNSKYTLLVLGFGSDFNTKKSVVIFSDLQTGQVHTIALALWNRWKLKEVKKINTET